jgi:membrane-bound inhibitor of C-type lysozyme
MSSRRPWILCAAVAAVLLAACQRKQEPAPAAPPAEPKPAPVAAPAAAPAPVAEEEAPPPGVLRAYVWDCGGNKLKARNLWRENAIAIDLHDGTHKLTSTPSASGAKYTDGTATLSTKGSAATLETAGNPAVQCNEIRAESLLEDARIRGVLYSARGNEPGWTLEIGPGSKLVWITGYGQERHEFANAQLGGNAGAEFVYTATDASGPVKATVRKAPCQDDMSGEAFDHQFVVTAGGRDYRGCGTRVQP